MRRHRKFTALRALGWLFAAAIVGCGGGGNTLDTSDGGIRSIDCTEHADCDDGLFCNGEEQCEQGRCLVGRPPDCDDGIDCTIDFCNEDRRECEPRVRDRDGDGVGDINCLDNDGVPLGSDCDDNDINIFPGNFEVCDADNKDEDCDPTTTGARDVDNDGFQDATCCNGTNCGNDCNDNRVNVNISVSEVCDGYDNDCDGNIDEGVAVLGWVDADHDSYGDDTASQNAMTACAGSPGFATIGGDCNDDDPTVNPGQPELCDGGKDNDCDSATDDSNAMASDWYMDSDGDGFGDPSSTPIRNCAPQPGYSLLHTDCDDNNSGINPAAAEICDGRDNDCNGEKDFLIPGTLNDFEDDDDDGLVDAACSPFGTDCDDGDPESGPGDTEICDGRDNDCDTRIDEGAQDRQWLADDDGDGFGSLASGSLIACQTQQGFVARGGDCDDGDQNRFPGQAETCDGLDQDCDGAVDEGTANAACSTIDHGAGSCVSGRCVVDRCDPGFGNCNDLNDDGCEVDFSTDNLHCGGCFNRCDFGTCVGGACTVNCQPEHEDCDENAANGCETNTSVSNFHCGGCDSPCRDTTNSAVTQCAAGQCVVVSCNDSSTRNCDDDSLNGCEVNVQENPNHCGECNRQCVVDPGAEGTATCVFGDCQLSCTGPLQSCDDDARNGCETDVETNTTNCGACGNVCPVYQNATDAMCSGGTCGIPSCMRGYDDCDQNPFNGCESPVDRDVFHCGGCGTNCADRLFNVTGIQCNRGVCGYDQCQPDFEDCVPDKENNRSTYGCETNTQTNPLHCGECQNNCSDLPNARQTFCSAGSCSAGSCVSGFDDCVDDQDDNPDSLGCETALSTDAGHCGTCNSDCGIAGECQQGSCNRVAAVAVGGSHSCALRERFGRGYSMFCWGDNQSGQLGKNDFVNALDLNETDVVPNLLPTEMALGDRHTCVIGASEEPGIVATDIFCWGDNRWSQTGQATSEAFNVPHPVVKPDGMESTEQIAAGASHTCALDANDGVYCWGDNTFGQLGNGATISAQNVTTPPVSQPTKVDLSSIAPVTIVSLQAGAHHTCIRTQSQGTYCWGRNDMGQLGDGTTDHRSTIGTKVHGSDAWQGSRLAVGANHACAETGAKQSLVCWGSNEFSQAGGTDGTFAKTPQRMPGTTADPTEFWAGHAHTCIRRDTDSDTDQVLCWGNNLNNRLGVEGNVEILDAPNVVSNEILTRMNGPSSNGMADHNCVVADTTTVLCWGSNSAGQLGRGHLDGFGVDMQPVSGLPEPAL